MSKQARQIVRVDIIPTRESISVGQLRPGPKGGDSVVVGISIKGDGTVQVHYADTKLCEVFFNCPMRFILGPPPEAEGAEQCQRPSSDASKAEDGSEQKVSPAANTDESAMTPKEPTQDT